jgi:ATP-dependent Clp protease ATP-binding subunit ClpA
VWCWLHNVAVLITLDNPVGYEEGGQLTEAIRRKPHSVVLFDEIEKAHEDVLNVLLQILDEGQLTDGKGRRVSFKNAIVVLTSNIGSQQIVDLSRESGLDSASLAEVIQTELEKEMKPELINRLDETIVFSPLSFDDLKSIASNLVDQTKQRAAVENQMSLTVADNLIEVISREGFVTASQYGARPIRRAVQKYLEDTLAEAIIRSFLQAGDEVKVELGKSQADNPQVKITKNFSNGSRLGESMMIAVNSSSDLSLEYLAFGDIPKLGDDEDDDDKRREPGASFQ